MKSKLSGFVKSVGDAVSSAADAATAATDISLTKVKSLAGKAGRSAGSKIGHTAEVTGQFTSKAGGMVSERAEKSYVVIDVKDASSSIADQILKDERIFGQIQQMLAKVVWQQFQNARA